ncbi:MAG TPA: TIGR00730 family Rossman fold protein [Vicinamibacterales bacterium]|nr:TIGR00730 family Rossman fold protein [Vicinamibacterales bacterium]
MKRLCIFCGSSDGNRPEYRDAASALAREAAARGIGLVFGGGAIGLMGAVADAALAAGGHVIGVIPHALVARELAHLRVPDLRVVASMHERKAMMAELSDAFVAAPGGFGTLEELCEVVTWSQLGLHRKRCGLLNVLGFYDPLLDLFDRAVKEGFIQPVSRQIVVSDSTPSGLLDQLAAPLPGFEPVWIRTPAQT